jgi:hypothetical protein
MRNHLKAIVAIFLLLGIGFAAAITTGSLYLALVVLLAGLVIAFVMTTAWMRPPGSSIEHHAPGDRLVDDTRP